MTAEEWTDQMPLHWLQPTPNASYLNYHEQCQEFVATLRAAILAEREACAMTAQNHCCDDGYGAHGVGCQHIIASDIRSRPTP